MIFAEQLNFCGAGLSHVLQIPTYILLSSCPMQVRKLATKIKYGK